MYPNLPELYHLFHTVRKFPNLLHKTFKTSADSNAADKYFQFIINIDTPQHFSQSHLIGHLWLFKRWSEM